MTATIKTHVAAILAKLAATPGGTLDSIQCPQ